MFLSKHVPRWVLSSHALPPSHLSQSLCHSWTTALTNWPEERRSSWTQNQKHYVCHWPGLYIITCILKLLWLLGIIHLPPHHHLYSNTIHITLWSQLLPFILMCPYLLTGKCTCSMTSAWQLASQQFIYVKDQFLEFFSSSKCQWLVYAVYFLFCVAERLHHNNESLRPSSTSVVSQWRPQKASEGVRSKWR